MRKLYGGKLGKILGRVGFQEEEFEAIISSVSGPISKDSEEFFETGSPLSATDGIDIKLQDAIAFMKNIPDASVDLVFADPPYFLSNDGTTCKNGKRASVNKGEWDRSMGVEENHAFFLAWLSECQRILKPSGTIFVTGTYHCIYSIGFAMQRLGFHVLNDISWHKKNAPPNLAGRQYAAKHETIIWAAPQKGKKLLHTFNYGLLKSKNTVYVCKCGDISQNGAKFCFNCGLSLTGAKQEPRQPTALFEINTPLACEKLSGKHSTQKPLKLLKSIIEATTNPGDLVVDPFLGGGTTAVACAIMGRNFSGCDLDPESIKISLKRLQNLNDVRELFDA